LFFGINFFFILVGETCFNNEDLNGTVFGQFRCPLYGFPYEAKYCCGEYGNQYCCARESNRYIFKKKLFFSPSISSSSYISNLVLKGTSGYNDFAK